MSNVGYPRTSNLLSRGMGQVSSPNVAITCRRGCGTARLSGSARRRIGPVDLRRICMGSSTHAMASTVAAGIGTWLSVESVTLRHAKIGTKGPEAHRHGSATSSPSTKRAQYKNSAVGIGVLKE